MSIDYRKKVINTIIELENYRDEVCNSIVNLSMAGENADINSLFDVGETLNLDIKDFENSNDTNIQKLIELLASLYEVNISIRNINSISQNEIDSYNK